MPEFIQLFYQALPSPWIAHVIAAFFIADGLALIVMGRHMMGRALAGHQSADAESENMATDNLAKAKKVATVFNVAAGISIVIGIVIALLTEMNS